jgi:hypothetical protein
MSPYTDLTLALILTPGDPWLVAGLVTLNRASYVCLRTIPTLVSVRFPYASHTPESPKPPLPRTISSVPFGVADPVSSWMVTVDPAGKSQLALIDTVIVFTTPANGVFCSTVLTFSSGTSTFRGLLPLATPSSSA